LSSGKKQWLDQTGRSFSGGLMAIAGAGGETIVKALPSFERTASAPL
jgi:hypothetical protein